MFLLRVASLTFRRGLFETIFNEMLRKGSIVRQERGTLFICPAGIERQHAIVRAAAEAATALSLSLTATASASAAVSGTATVNSTGRKSK